MNQQRLPLTRSYLTLVGGNNITQELGAGHGQFMQARENMANKHVNVTMNPYISYDGDNKQYGCCLILTQST